MTLTPISTRGSCAGPGAGSGWGRWVGSWVAPTPLVPSSWCTALGPNESTAPSETSRVISAGSPGRRRGIAPHLWGRIEYFSSPTWDKDTRVHLFNTYLPAAPFDQVRTAHQGQRCDQGWGLVLSPGSL